MEVSVDSIFKIVRRIQSDLLKIFNDYLDVKEDYLIFKKEATERINTQTELLNKQSSAIIILQKQIEHILSEQKEASEFIENGKRPKSTTKH